MLHRFIVNGLKAWHKPEHPVPYTSELLLIEQARFADTDEPSAHAAYFAIKQVIVDCLEILSARSPEEAEILRLRYIDNLYLKQIALAKQKSVEQVKHLVRRGKERLVQIAEAQEMARRQEEIGRLQSYLPHPTYNTLFGVIEQCAALQAQLTAAGNTVLAITGIGGIGKTSLVRAAVKQLLDAVYFRELIWLCMRQGQLVDLAGGVIDCDDLIPYLLHQLDPTFPASSSAQVIGTQLRRRLATTRTLLVIDNLESRTEVATILQTVEPFIDRLKVVITSREVPEVQPRLTRYKLSEMDYDAVVALIHNHAQLVNCTLLADDSGALSRPIFEVIGGNPLAIKLIVGLAAELELELLLDDLVAATHHDIDEMYRYIFQKAWDQLSESAQLLLMIMPLATERGMSLALMQHNSGLTFGEVGSAIAELTRRSLLDVNGTTLARTYTIHQLTRAFLGSSIINWQGALP